METDTGGVSGCGHLSNWQRSMCMVSKGQKLRLYCNDPKDRAERPEGCNCRLPLIGILAEQFAVFDNAVSEIYNETEKNISQEDFV